MRIEQIKQRENVEFELRDKDGNIKLLWNEYFWTQKLRTFLKREMPRLWLFGFYAPTLRVRNLITSAGKAGAASRLNGDGAEAAFTYIAVGIGTGAAAAGDTTLGSETTTAGLARAAGTASRVTTTVANDTAQLLKAFSVTGTVAVTESGVLNAASVGVLLCRQVFSAINVVNGDTLTITWKIANA